MNSFIKIFCSYSSKDEDFKRELLTHLSPLEREGKVRVWHFPLISPGREWDVEIKRNLADADIVVLLISPDFLESDYIMSVELADAVRRHEMGLIRVIPIICRASDWKNQSFAKLNGLPIGAKPIKTWPDRDEAWLDVVTKLRKEVESIHALARNSNVSLAKSAAATGDLTIPKKGTSGESVLYNAQEFSFKFQEHRDPLTYHVWLHDRPQVGTDFLIQARASHYVFYDSELSFSRRASHPAKQVTVAIITDLSTYSQRLNFKKLIYGEVVGIDKTDRPAWDDHMRAIVKAADAKDRMALLSKVMRLHLKVNGEALMLESFRREPFGFELCFGLRHDIQDTSMHLQFSCQSFQPRTLAHFPFVISELTKNLEFRIDYSDMAIESAEYFAAFAFNRTPDILNDFGTRVLSVRSREGEWMFPGSGVVLNWK